MKSIYDDYLPSAIDKRTKGDSERCVARKQKHTVELRSDITKYCDTRELRQSPFTNLH